MKSPIEVFNQAYNNAVYSEFITSGRSASRIQSPKSEPTEKIPTHDPVDATTNPALPRGCVCNGD